MNIKLLSGLLLNPDRTFFAAENLHGQVLNYGCGRRKEPEHIGIDIDGQTLADHVIQPDQPFPLPDHSCDYVISRNVLEHIVNLNAVIGEIFRVLKPQGKFRCCVPHAFSQDAYDDPTHVRFFTRRTMAYYVGKSDVHYRQNWFAQADVYLRLGLAYPRCKLARYPANLLLGTLGLLMPELGEQLLKLPLLCGTLYIELTKSADWVGNSNDG